MPTTNLFDLSAPLLSSPAATAALGAESPLAWLKPELRSPFWHVMRRRTSVS